MKKAITITAVILGVWSLIFALGRGRKTGTEYGPAGGVAAEKPGDRALKKGSLRETEATILAWPQPAQRAARRMIQKYGTPDQVTGRKLIWNDNGPWKRTIVRRDAGTDVLEHVAVFRVPSDRFDVIRRLQGNVSAERGRDELSAKSGSESLNFLSLNLAEEVITGKRDVEDARRFYEKTSKLAVSGKTSSYTESLLFAEPARAEEKKP